MDTVDQTATQPTEPAPEGGAAVSFKVPSTDPKVVWGRRIVIFLALAFAVFVLVKGTERAETSLDVIDPDPVIVVQAPLPGSIVLYQSEVGVELQPGYDGRLIVNGVEIPEDQLEGAVDPSTLTPEQLQQHGVRPNGRNRLFFDPAAGKAVEELPQGVNTVTVLYHRDRQPEVDTGSVSWTFTVQ